jgi:hypothetical protein
MLSGRDCLHEKKKKKKRKKEKKKKSVCASSRLLPLGDVLVHLPGLVRW